MPIWTAEHDALRAAVSSLLAKESGPDRRRASESSGFDPRLWSRLRELGVPELGIPEPLDGHALDMAIVVEECGRHLASAPVVEVFAASRILARIGATSDEPGDIVTLAVRPAEGGVARMVPAGAIANAVIGLDGDDLVLVRPSTPRPVQNTGQLALADIPFRDPHILATGDAARAAHARAVAEWKILAAGRLAGVAQSALREGIAYACSRRQFGTAIASFQAIQHRLADLATAVEGARLLAASAATALDEDSTDVPVQASMAYAFCGEAAQRAAAESLHLHGGYGVTLEYEAHRYLRQAKTWSVLAGDPAHEYQHVAEAVLE